MPRSTLARRQSIERLVNETGRILLTDLAQRLGVSPETLRRDLVYLERAGALERRHGEVVAPTWSIEPGITARLSLQVEEKRRLSMAALDYLPRQGFVFVDSGSTFLPMAPLLRRFPDLTIVTTNIMAAVSASSSNNLPVIYLIGGLVRPLTADTMGGKVLEELTRYSFETVFLGANLVTPQGLYTPALEEASVKETAAKNGRQVVVVADGSKHRLRGTGYLFATWKDVHVLLTTGPVPDETMTAAGAAGVEVVVR